MSKSVIVQAASLPPTNELFTTKSKPTALKDAVRAAIMNGAYERLHPYLQTVNKKEGVTGSLVMDRAAAAMELQKWGHDKGVEIIQEANWTELDRCINIALKAIKDENGQSIDRNTRRLAAIASRPASPASLGE
jgi:hypothetical protein